MTTPIYMAYADDHTLVRAAITDLIHKSDERFRVIIEAEDGKALLENIEKAAQKPDVCIIDISMPRMNGYEAQLEIRKQYPSVRSLALTMADNDHAILQMLANGALGYVTKNVNSGELRKAITDVYNGNFYFCEEVLKISRNNIWEHTEQLLSEQEIKLMNLLCSDMTNETIAGKMHLSTRTVGNIILNLCNKLKIRSRLGLALYAVYAGIGSFKR